MGHPIVGQVASICLQLNCNVQTIEKGERPIVSSGALKMDREESIPSY